MNKSAEAKLQSTTKANKSTEARIQSTTKANKSAEAIIQFMTKVNARIQSMAKEIKPTEANSEVTKPTLTYLLRPTLSPQGK